MSADFVPFAAALRNRIAGPPQSQFTPVGAAPLPSPAPTHAHEPKVEVKRTGDRITQIQITCRCGELIEIACEY